jgi:hypothetical protein
MKKLLLAILLSCTTALAGSPIYWSGPTSAKLIPANLCFADGSCMSTAGGGGGGSGTVTSVGLTMPSIFTVGNSPITTFGSIGVTLGTQAAARVWAGPITGDPAAPEFRLLVASDIPTLAASKISDFQTTVSSNSDVTANTSARHAAATITTANGLSVLGQAFSMATADTSTTGALTSTDWNIFNGKQAAGSYITALTSDVTASGPGSVAATVAYVGTSSAANIHTAEELANAATDAATASTIVKRDSLSGFKANKIEAGISQLIKIGGAVDAFGRTLIHNYEPNAGLKLGGWGADGDPVTASSEGIVVYGASLGGTPISSQPNYGSYARIKNDRFGFYSIDPALSGYTSGAYSFRTDNTEMYYRDNAGVQTFKVTRATGNITTTGILKARYNVTDGGNADYQILATDYHVRTGTTLTADRAYTLPACTTATIGAKYEVKNLPAQTFNIILTALGTDKIDGDGTFTVLPGDSVPVICSAYGTFGTWDIE